MRRCFAREFFFRFVLFDFAIEDMLVLKGVKINCHQKKENAKFVKWEQ